MTLSSPAPGPAALPLPSEGACAPVRVLLVDDNVDALETMQALLELCDFQVRSTSDPQEALAIASGFRPQVCVLDIGLPGMDGYELATHLRRLVKQPARLVALTGYGQHSDKERALGAGFDVHLTKPVQLSTLLEAAQLPAPPLPLPPQ